MSGSPHPQRRRRCPAAVALALGEAIELQDHVDIVR
jgi:hypothetical protein